MPAGVGCYRDIQVTTSSSVGVIVLLYDAAVQAMKLAREGIVQGRPVEKVRFLQRALGIVSELSSALDMERGGEIARNLRRIYDFVLNELTHANLRNDAQRLDGSIRCFSLLREAWEGIARQPVAKAP